MFQSNMCKSTVDGNCMTKKMLIVMFSTNPAKKKMYKKINKNNYIFCLYLTGFKTVTSGFDLAFYSSSSALDPSAILAHLYIGIQYIKIGKKCNVKGDYS